MSRRVGESGFTVAEAADQLWDVDDADRFARLARGFPDLLTHDEQVIWKLIRSCAWFWRGPWTEKNPKGVLPWEDGELLFDRLRDRWLDINAVARGEKARSVLPENPEQDPNAG